MSKKPTKTAGAKRAAARKLNSLASQEPAVPTCNDPIGCMEPAAPTRENTNPVRVGKCKRHGNSAYARWKKANDDAAGLDAGAPPAKRKYTRRAVAAAPEIAPSGAAPAGFDVAAYVARCLRAVERIGGPDSAEKIADVIEASKG